jgi:hypothetical protein
VLALLVATVTNGDDFVVVARLVFILIATLVIVRFALVKKSLLNMSYAVLLFTDGNYLFIPVVF